MSVLTLASSSASVSVCIWENTFTPYLSWKAELPCLSYKYLLRTCSTLLRLICLCTITHALNCVKLNTETKLNNEVTIRCRGGPFIWSSIDQSKIKIKHASKWAGYVELFLSVNECEDILTSHPGCVPPSHSVCLVLWIKQEHWRWMRVAWWCSS